MIFVTVGTTLPFDALIEAVDTLVGSGQVGEEVICQIGNGAYTPVNCEYFKFKPGLDELIANARLVIGHGGTGTVLSLMRMGKKFIAVANPLGADNHQHEFLHHLGQRYNVLWTDDPNTLGTLIDRVDSVEVKPIDADRISDSLASFISGE